jgi:hypothetical protein
VVVTVAVEAAVVIPVAAAMAAVMAAAEAVGLVAAGLAVVVGEDVTSPFSANRPNADEN